MKIPKVVQILGRDIEVKMVDEEPSNAKGEGLAGNYDHGTREIVIHSKQSDQDLFDTMCHEMAHGHIIFTGWDQRLTEREIECLCQLMTLHAGDVVKALIGDIHAKARKTKRKKT